MRQRTSIFDAPGINARPRVIAPRSLAVFTVVVAAVFVLMVPNPTLERRAGNSTHIDSIREPARLAVTKFVKAWLLTHQQQSGIDKIVVLFPDEPAAKDGSAARQAAVPLSLVP